MGERHYTWRRRGDRWRGLSLFLRARFSVTVLVCSVAAVASAHMFIMAVADISVADARPTRFLGVLEITSFACVLISVYGLGGRLLWLERLGDSAYLRHVAGVAVVCIVLPQVVLLASLPALPLDTSPDAWRWIPANLLLWSSVALVLTALLGRVLGLGVGLALFAGMLVLQNAAGPVLPWLPFAHGQDPEPRWAVAAGAAAIAVVVYPARASSTPLESAIRRNEV